MVKRSKTSSNYHGHTTQIVDMPLYGKHIYVSSQKSDWPPFGGNDTLRFITVLFVSCLFFVVSVTSTPYFVFADGILGLIVTVPDCLLFIKK